MRNTAMDSSSQPDQLTSKEPHPLIIGALFAGGAFVGQILSSVIQNKGNLFDKALGDERTKDLEDLGKKFWQLEKRIDRLRNEP